MALGLSLSVHAMSPVSGIRLAGHFCDSTITLLSFLPPIFILLGLFDTWVPREKIMHLMGHESGCKGTILAFLLGAMAAGPLYLAFPIANALRAKGAWIFNVMIFIGAWSTLKLPMFLFEAQSLGAGFALTRYGTSFLSVVVIAKSITWLSQWEK